MLPLTQCPIVATIVACAQLCYNCILFCNSAVQCFPIPYHSAQPIAGKLPCYVNTEFLALVSEQAKSEQGKSLFAY